MPHIVYVLLKQHSVVVEISPEIGHAVCQCPQPWHASPDLIGREIDSTKGNRATSQYKEPT